MVTRVNRQAQKNIRTVRGFCRVAKVGRISRARAIALALADLVDQIKAARKYGTKDERDTITAHLKALKSEGKA
jgi:hypothetical protein